MLAAGCVLLCSAVKFDLSLCLRRLFHLAGVLQRLLCPGQSGVCVSHSFPLGGIPCLCEPLNVLSRPLCLLFLLLCS